VRLSEVANVGFAMFAMDRLATERLMSSSEFITVALLIIMVGI
jgi:hypothetical protein